MPTSFSESTCLDLFAWTTPVTCVGWVPGFSVEAGLNFPVSLADFGLTEEWNSVAIEPWP